MSNEVIHPKFKDLEEFCLNAATNHHQAVQVYIDLSECKNWWNLQVKPCMKEKLLLICGHETQFEPETYVLPISSDAQVSLSEMDKYKAMVKNQFKTNVFLLGIVDSDSAVVYYRISDGLVPPERPEELEAKKLKSQRYRERRKLRNMKYNNIADALSLRKGIDFKISQKPSASKHSSPYTSSAACQSNSHHDNHVTHSSSAKTVSTAMSSFASSAKNTDSSNKAQTTFEKSSSLFDSPYERNRTENKERNHMVNSQNEPVQSNFSTVHEINGTDNTKNVSTREGVKSLDKECTHPISPEDSASNSEGLTVNHTQNAFNPMDVQSNTHRETSSDNVLYLDHTGPYLEQLEGGQRTLPNMAPEDFEDMEYGGDFEGEL